MFYVAENASQKGLTFCGGGFVIIISKGDETLVTTKNDVVEYEDLLQN